MEPKRAYRIRHKQRMKAKAVRIFASIGFPNPANIKLADHLAHCSKSCCCNPRRSKFHSGASRLTMQERKFLEGWGGLGEQIG